MATFGSPLYCIPQGEKGLLLGGGSVSFPLDCLETDDRPFEVGMEGVFTDEVVVGVAGCAPEVWAFHAIC